MKSSFFLATATAAALLTAAVLAVTVAAQAPQAQQTADGTPDAHHDYPAPTNLKVLPKNLTGEQIHEIMERWEAALGTHCGTCHTANPNNIAPNGHARLDFADDTKPEKSTARFMYTMTEDINKNYVSMIESSGAPVTCGTCHRGHLGPEPFMAVGKSAVHDSQNPPSTSSTPSHPE